MLNTPNATGRKTNSIWQIARYLMGSAVLLGACWYLLFVWLEWPARAQDGQIRLALNLAEQLRSLRSGGSPISPVIARQLLKILPRPDEPVPADKAAGIALTPQESRVLALAAKGYSYDEVAGLMEVSRHTVMTYVKRIYRRLQVHSKSEAVYEARRMGLILD